MDAFGPKKLPAVFHKLPSPRQAPVAGCKETTINECIHKMVSVMISTKRFDVIEGLSYVPRTQDSTRRWDWLLLEHLQDDGSYQEEDLSALLFSMVLWIYLLLRSTRRCDCGPKKRLFELLRVVGGIGLHASSGVACLGDSLRLLEINVKRMKLLLISKRLGRRLFLKMLVVSSVLRTPGVSSMSAMFVRGLIRITRGVPVGKGMPIIGVDVFRTGSTVRSAELEDPMDNGSASETITPSNSSGLAPRELAHRLSFS